MEFRAGCSELIDGDYVEEGALLGHTQLSGVNHQEDIHLGYFLCVVGLELPHGQLTSIDHCTKGIASAPRLVNGEIVNMLFKLNRINLGAWDELRGWFELSDRLVFFCIGSLDSLIFPYLLPGLVKAADGEPKIDVGGLT